MFCAKVLYEEDVFGTGETEEREHQDFFKDYDAARSFIQMHKNSMTLKVFKNFIEGYVYRTTLIEIVL